MTALSTICTILRFIQRLSIGLMWDDWCIIGALLFAYGFMTTTILVATVAHAGYHVSEYVVWELNTYMKACFTPEWHDIRRFRRLTMSLLQIALANNIIYNASITLSKASVVYFYYRIFGIDRVLRLQLRIVTALLAGYSLAALFGLIFADRPVQAQWDVMLPHTSINNKAF